MTFNSALEAKSIVYNLEKRLSNYRYNADLYKMMRNIDQMINLLSKEEVLVRQTHRTHNFLKKKKEIEDAIDRIEKLILIRALTD